MTPEQTYQTRIAELNGQIKRLNGRKNIIAWTRFVTVIAIFTALYFLWPAGLSYALMTSVLLTAIFLRLVVLSARNNERIDHLKLLLSINMQEVAIADGQYTSRPEGNQFLSSQHDYAQDLDIFGRASLFQYINRTTSEQGNQILASWLLSPATKEIVLERQRAVKEMAPYYQERQEFHAFGLANTVTQRTQTRIDTWLEEANQFSAPHWKWIRFVLPAIILSALVMTMAEWLPLRWFLVIVLVFLLFSSFIAKRVTPVYIHLGRIVPEVETLSKSINWIEQQDYKSAFYRNLRELLMTSAGPASSQVKTLKAILDKLDYRLYLLLSILLNVFLLWDLQQILALEKWKTINRQKVAGWFSALAEMEAISSLAALRFNHPAWTMPVLVDKKGTLQTNDVGHPLIPAAKRVTSSFATTGEAKIALITGSNMAGKSTFLRSIGINTVLAMMGAPVCASAFTVYPMRIVSSMRVTDNLEENTSTFYAELKKLKYIIEAVNRGEKVFLLLDEVLRGTNSLDRHTGSRALIHQMIRHDGVGMLATHDLELASLEQEFPSNIHNYHFDVQVAGEELYFDYKLKEGVCKSMNASILMKKIGIEL